METYKEMRDRQKEEVENFPFIFAFCKEQLDDEMDAIGILGRYDLILYLGGGCYIEKEDREEYILMNQRHRREFYENIEQDTTGMDFCCGMFEQELNNHEYVLTWDEDETIDALGLKPEDFRKYPQLKAGLDQAVKNIKSIFCEVC